LRAVDVGDTLQKLRCDEQTIKLWKSWLSKNKFVLKPPIRREDLLRFTEHDPEGAEEFLELLREFREDRQSRADPT